MGFPSRGFARLAGDVGRRNRWMNTTPEQRREQLAHVRAGQHAKYVERAAALAAQNDLTPTPEQLDRAAHAIWQADLAERRLLAWRVLQAPKGGAI
jgi:hypothetical protein